MKMNKFLSNPFSWIIQQVTPGFLGDIFDGIGDALGGLFDAGKDIVGKVAPIAGPVLGVATGNPWLGSAIGGLAGGLLSNQGANAASGKLLPNKLAISSKYLQKCHLEYLHCYQ